MTGPELDQLSRFADGRLVGHLKRFCSEYKIRPPDYYGRGGCDTQLLTRIDNITKDLAFRLVHDVYSLGECTKTFTLEAVFVEPATWLDAFRERFKAWIPNWILKRWKYNTKTLRKVEKYTVDAMALLPQVPIQLDRKDVQFCLSESRR